MIFRRRRLWRLRDYVLFSWLAPAAFAIVASLMVFILLGWLDYQNQIKRVTSDLAQKSITASRRASAEILLGEQGALPSVLELLTKKLEVSNIRVVQNACGAVQLDACTRFPDGALIVNKKIPHVDGDSYVALTHPLRPLYSFLNLYLFAWSAFPVFLALGMGLVFQRAYLRRVVLNPINSLVDAAERDTQIPEHWPAELKEIAQNLAESFEAREQAVFAMLAKGVVHDIKTFLHSLLTATELVREQQADDAKRLARLEALFRACDKNLPKMKRIIELTLDGSVDIPIRPAPASIDATIQGAIEANREQARNKGVVIDYQSSPSHTPVAHDPVQLERALSNLIKNGIEAAGERATGAQAKTVRVSTQKDAAGVLSVSVEDTGPGLGERSDILFKPTRSTKAHGAGLGLYITGKIIRGHGGEINAGRSTALGGALFTFSLPKKSVREVRV